MESAAAFEKVSKLEAAERELRVAIRMFFERKDMIAVHTLAAAAQAILRDLGRSKGILSLFEEGLTRVRTEKRDEVNQALRRAQNFFKHADRDASEKLEFYPDGTKFYLIDAARLFVLLTGRHVPETTALTAYFIVKHPNFFNFDDVPQLQRIKELAAKLDLNDFDMILQAMSNLQFS